MKYFSILLLTCFIGVSNANEEQASTPTDDNIPAIVIVCPEHSANSGDEVPTWATTVDAVNFYCNDKQEPDTATTAEADTESESE